MPPGGPRAGDVLVWETSVTSEPPTLSPTCQEVGVGLCEQQDGVFARETLSFAYIPSKSIRSLVDLSGSRVLELQGS